MEAKLSGSSVGVPTLAPEQESHSSLYTAPASIVDSHTHLLHGVVHLNGYGHLLRINGMEGGSLHLTGIPPRFLAHVSAGLQSLNSCDILNNPFVLEVQMENSVPCPLLHPHAYGILC